MSATQKHLPFKPAVSAAAGDDLVFLSGRTMGVASPAGETSKPDRDLLNIFATFMTTLATFGIFLIQGIIVARVLGPTGRGEFGTAMFFPRDVFLYAGLLGGIEIVNSYAVRASMDAKSLKYSAARLGILSGLITAVFAGSLSIVVMLAVGKTYLIPFCLLCCLFLPFEHMQLTISAVDRGTRKFKAYNLNRLVFAAAFAIIISVWFGLGIDQVVPFSCLTEICVLFALSRVVGLLPTLRGMDIWNTFIQRNSSSENESFVLGKPGTVEMDESIEVPSAWTLLKQGRFYALSMLVSELFERLDVFLVVAIATVTESGFYFVAVPAAQLLIIAPHALGIFTFNAGADKERRPGMRQALTVMSSTLLLQVVSAVVLAAIIPFLIILFFKEPFAPAIPFALALLPAYAIKGFNHAADSYLKGRDKPMIGVQARSISIVVMLAFVALVYANVITIFDQKLFCIPIAALIGQAISMIIITAAVLKDTLNEHLDSATPVGGLC